MAQFKINENRVNPGYFTDDNLNRNNRNNVLTDRTALERPRSDSEIFQTNLDYQLNYGNSISELQNTMEDMDKVTGDFYDLTGISLNMNDYIAEVDDNYLNIDYDVSDPMSLKAELIKEWGDHCVVPISNWNTLQMRYLIKDIAKFYDVPFT